MSNSQSLIAFRGPAQQVVLDAWDSLELIETKECGNDYEVAWQWASSRDGYIDGSSDAELCPLIARDGEYNVLIDFSMLMGAEDDRLSALSKSAPVYVAVTQGTAGCASFAGYRDGSVVRRIDYVDGVVETEGEPLPEEDGINLAEFYEGGLEVLWKRLGLSGLLFTANLEDFLALHCRDTSLVDIDEFPCDTPLAKRPWWKFW